jgi:predicted amidophosphoribosyltransferase
MKNMTPAERQNNLKKAFQAFGNDVELNSIMLIDDIYTTGATMDACAQALYRQGACRVCFITLAAGVDSGS